MQQVSALYNQILAQANHFYETKVQVGSTTYSEDRLFYVKTKIAVFRDGPVVGETPSQEIDLAIRNPGKTFPRMVRIRPYIRLVGEDPNTGNVIRSEWVSQGTFYSDTKSTTLNDGGIETCTIHGYDSMLKAEQDYSKTSLSWPATDINIVSEIASKIGVTVDSRTNDIMTAGYQLPLPTSYSLREYLSIIAAKYLGFFIVTEQNKLLLQSLLSIPVETNLLVNEVGQYITFGGYRIEV